MKISDRDKLLILILILACVIGLPIYFLIVPSSKQIKAYEAEFESLGERYEYLKGLYENKAFYESEITSLTAKRDSLISDYAPGIRQENIIMFLRAIELSENPIEMKIETFNSYNRTKITDDYTNAEGEVVQGLTALNTSTTVSYVAEYEDVKVLLDYIFKENKKMNISSISMQIDPQTNQLKGIFVLDQYAITGEGRELESCFIPEVEHGLVNNRLFNVYYDKDGKPLSAKDEVEEEEENAEGEAEESVTIEELSNGATR